MRTREIALLRQQEIAEEKKKKSIIYLPIGFLEWHSYAMPMGTDSITAEGSALRAAEQTGGVVLPPLYCAPYQARPGVEKIGIEPENSCVKSFFFHEEVFIAMIRDYLRVLVEQSYKLIVLVTGHGGDGFTEVIEGLCEEVCRRTGSRAFLVHSWADRENPPYSIGHATLLETATMMYLTESVELGCLPPKTEQLSCEEYGFWDCKMTEDGYVNEIDDPRNATVEIGRKCIENGVEFIVNKVEEEYLKI